MDIEKEISKSNSGSAIAQHYLGLKYKKGDGVPQDYFLAFHWFKKAAEQELPEAIYQLGLMYEEGKGVEQNDIEAVNCYAKAKELLGSRKNNDLWCGIFIPIVFSVPVHFVFLMVIVMSFDAPGSDKNWSAQVVSKILDSGLYVIVPVLFALVSIFLKSLQINRLALRIAFLTVLWPIFLLVFRIVTAKYGI